MLENTRTYFEILVILSLINGCDLMKGLAIVFFVTLSSVVVGVPAAYIVLDQSGMLGEQMNDEMIELSVFEGNNHSTGDPYVINEILINGNVLDINLSYSGGCATHAFDLFAPNSFLESSPPQTTLYLYHESNDDYCEAWITEVVSFDLQPLADLFADMYKSHHGDVLCNLHGTAFSLHYSF